MAQPSRSICPFCSMGCTWRPGRDASAHAGEPGDPTLDYERDHGPNRGSLCAKGNMSLELMTHPSRLEAPAVRRDGRAAAADWDHALAHAAAGIARVRGARGGAAVGILVGPRATVEEAAAAARLARAVGTPHADLCEPGDHAVLAGIGLSGARPAPVESVAQIAAMNAVLVVGDLFTLAPCAARSVLDARYANRRHVVAVLGALGSRTAWFGRPALRTAPNGEAAALAQILAAAPRRAGGPESARADDARRALAAIPAGVLERSSGIPADQAATVAKALADGPASGVLLASEFGATERSDLVAGLAALLAEATGARFLAMLEGANSAGVRAVLAAEGFAGAAGLAAPEILEAAVTGDVRCLVVVGADPAAAFPGDLAAAALRAAEFSVVTSPFPNASTAGANVVLPTAVYGETRGTVLGAFGAHASLVPAMRPPGAARSDLDVLDALAAALPPAADEPPSPPATAHPRPAAPDFLRELSRHLGSAPDAAQGRDAGTHLLVAEPSATNAAEGSLTARLSWARYAHPEPVAAIGPADAARLGVRTGDRVRLRSAQGRAELRVRVDRGLPAGVVTAPHRDAAVRGLLRWRREPVPRCLDLGPDRVSLERAGEVRP